MTRETPLRENLQALAAFAAASAVIYHEYWLGTKIISGKDFLTGFHLLLNFQSDCLQQGSWPLWNPFMNFGFPFVEHYINSAFFPTHLLMGLVTGSSMLLIQREVLCWIVIGGFGVYLCVRQSGLTQLTGVLAGTAFMACGQMAALPQWNTLVYNAACFPWLLYGYHRASGCGRVFSPVSIAFLAFTILGGYTVTTVLGIYLFFGYVAADAIRSRRYAFAVRYFAVTVTAAVLLSLPKLVPLYAGLSAGPRLAGGTPSPGARLDDFNIISLYNFWSLLLPVKLYFSLFIGSLGILALVHGIRKREIGVTPLLVMTVLSGWLLLSGDDGSPSLLRSTASYLPFMRLVRNDWLSWFYPSIFAILFLARPVESFLADRSVKERALTAGIHAALLTTGYLLVFDRGLYGGAYAVHLTILAAWVLAALLPTSRPRLQEALVLALVTSELLLVFQRVDVTVPPRFDGARILFTVIDQGSVSRSYDESSRLRSAFRAAATADTLRPGVDEARRKPFLTSGLGGDPAYNMYPEQYGRFIDAMNYKQFAGWWYNTQERFEFIRLKDSPLLTALDGAPLAGLYDRRDLAPLPGGISFDRLTCSSFTFTATTDRPSFLLLRQMYDDRWTVEVDGERSAPVRAETYFQAALVEPGTHRVVFRFSDPPFTAAVWLSGTALAGLVGAGLWLRRRDRLAGTQETVP